MRKIKPRFDDTTTVGRLLNEHSIGLRSISRASGAAPNTIKRVLDKRCFSKTYSLQKAAVRNAVERLLKAYQWDGEPSDLWNEFDVLEEHHEAAA